MLNHQTMDYKQQKESLLSSKIKKIKGFCSNTFMMPSSALPRTSPITSLTTKEINHPNAHTIKDLELTTTSTRDQNNKTLLFVKYNELNKSYFIFQGSTLLSMASKQQKREKCSIKLEEKSVNKGKSKSKAKTKKPKKTVDQVQKLTFKFFKTGSNSQRKKCIYETIAPNLRDVDGEGTIVTSEGKIIEGNFCQGVPIGEVRITCSNRAIYKGPVYDGLPHGKGTMIYPEGYKYEGQFCYGEPHGDGLYFNEKGQLKLQGEWKRGKFFR